MAEVTLTIGDRRHAVACRDGEEAQLRKLGEMLDQRWVAASRASGGVSGERTMLLVALMLADGLDAAQNRPADDGGPGPAWIAHLADKLEGIADALENSSADA